MNVLSPVWMQVTHKSPGPDPLQAWSVKQGIRKETNRTFLMEKMQPSKSLFEFGAIRHNVHSSELAEEWQTKALNS